MGALDLPGVRPVLPASDAAAAQASLPPMVPIDCWRVPAQVRSSVAVPCLGALTAAALLDLQRRAAGRTLVLLDRGWCRDCPAGGNEHPAGTALAACVEDLAALGLAPSRHPRVQSAPLPVEVAAPRIPGAASAAPISRRAFLGRLAEPAVRAAQTPVPHPMLAGGAPVHPSLAYRAHAEAVSALAGALGVAYRPSLPRLTASAACRDHQVCTPVCPTGALRGYREGERSGLRFDPADCIACGLCLRHCPERALAWTSNDDDANADTAPGPRELTRFTLRSCPECGADFTDAGPVCPACAMDHAFAHDAFRGLFGGASPGLRA